MQKQKFLVISPHPDDLDFACAGTIAKLTREGNIVEELIISDGSKGSHKLGFGGRKLAKIREAEEIAAAVILGALKVHFLREIDGEVENTRELRKKLVEKIREIRPDIVLSFDPAGLSFESVYRSHRDHRMAAEAVFDALYPAAGNASFFPELLKKGVLPHKSREVWFFSALRPNKFVNIEKTIELKLRALQCHKSQIAEGVSMAKRIRERAKDTAKGKRMKYAESFRVIELD